VSAQGLQPLDHIVLSSPETLRGIQCRAVCVVRFPVEISTSAQQALGGSTLPGTASVPKPLRNLLCVDTGHEQIVQTVEHSTLPTGQS